MKLSHEHLPRVKLSARDKRLPSVEQISDMVETGEAWRQDDYTSRYAAALVAAGIVAHG